MDPSALENVFATIEKCFNQLHLYPSWNIKKVECPQMVVIYRATTNDTQLDSFDQKLDSAAKLDYPAHLSAEVKTERELVDTLNDLIDGHDQKEDFCLLDMRNDEKAASNEDASNEPDHSVEDRYSGHAVTEETTSRRKRKVAPVLHPQKKLLRKEKKTDPDFKCPKPKKISSKPTKQKNDDDPDFNYDEAIEEIFTKKKSGPPFMYPELREIKPNAQGLYKCPNCEYAIEVKSTLTQHYKKHVEEYKCTFCLLKFTKKRTLQSHLDNFHNDGEGKLQCHKCEMRFAFQVG